MTAPDTPFRPKASLALGDRVFHGGARSIGVLVLLIFGSIGFFLSLQAVPTLRRYGWSFFTETNWVPETDQVGLAAVVFGTVVVALIALAIAFPLSLTTALFISEYAPRRLRSWRSSSMRGSRLISTRWWPC